MGLQTGKPAADNRGRQQSGDSATLDEGNKQADPAGSQRQPGRGDNQPPLRGSQGRRSTIPASHMTTAQGSRRRARGAPVSSMPHRLRAPSASGQTLIGKMLTPAGMLRGPPVAGEGSATARGRRSAAANPWALAGSSENLGQGSTAPVSAAPQRALDARPNNNGSSGWRAGSRPEVNQ